MERATNHLMFRVFITVILVAVAFCAGFVLRSQTALVASWGIPVTEEEPLPGRRPGHLRVRERARG